MVIVAVVTKEEMTHFAALYHLDELSAAEGGVSRFHRLLCAASNAFISRINSPIAVGSKCSPPIAETTCTVVTLVTVGRDN